MPQAPVISALRARPVRVPIRRPLATATGALTPVPLVLVDIETDLGVTGVGYVFTPAGYAAKPLAAMVEGLGELVKGDPVAPFAVEQKVRKRMTLLGVQGLAMLALSGIRYLIP
jgi:mandelate racemase